jgi:hypothetical protein
MNGIHDDVWVRLSALLEGELSSEEARDLEDMIARDPTLQEAYREIRRVSGLLRAQGPVAAPPGFAARVLAAVADEPMVPAAAGWRWPRLESALLVAAAAAVLWMAVPRVGADSALATGGGAGVDEVAVGRPATAQPVVLDGKMGASPDASEATDPVRYAASFRYSVRRDTPDALLDLARLAARFGGELRMANGRPLDPAAPVTGRALVLRVPADHLAELDAAIRGLAPGVHASGSAPADAGTLEVTVSVLLP